MVKALKNYPDVELVTMAQRGNEQAISALVCRYRPFVLRLAKRTFASDAEDITHDVFVKVLLHLDRFEQRSSFTTWLYRITMNQILKAKQNERLQHSLEMAGEIEDGAVDEELAGGESMLRHYLAGMLLCLDEEQRMVIILSDLFKMDHNASAEALDISPDNFRKRLSRARKDLRSWTENKCSLVVRGHQCQCNRKAQYFLKQGWVDPVTGRFTKDRVTTVSEYVESVFNL